MISFIRTNSENTDFLNLVTELDKDLHIRDGEDHAFYAQFNKTTNIKYAVVAYDGSTAVGCGAIKEYAEDTMEVKRMYVLPGSRGQGVASAVLKILEQWAVELSCKKLVLETGKNQPEAIALYGKNGYTRIPNYGQYQTVENSVCFIKEMKGFNNSPNQT